VKKKPTIYFFTLLLIISICILLLVNNIINKNEKVKQDEIIKKKEEKNTIEYKANQTIRVRFSKTGEIVAMDINDYLRGVVPSEMSPTYNIEALKAQALVARTYTYRKILNNAEGNGADICDNYAHCQAFYPKEKLFEIWGRKDIDETTKLEYWDKVNEAVVSTQNEIITYNGECIKAFFHASSPIKTENIDQIWGGEKLPYLLSVESSEDEGYANRTSQNVIPFLEFKEKLLSNNLVTDELNIEEIKNSKINEFTTSGRVKNIIVGKFLISAEKLRTIFGLKSTNFTIVADNNNITFNVIGYGHGVGMSQVGANFYANSGMNYVDIIKHYYTGVEVTKLN